MVATFFSMPYPIHPKAPIIRDLMSQLRVSQRELGRRSGLAYNLIGKYLDGLMKPNQDDAFDLMEKALHDIERERRTDGTLPVKFAQGLPIFLLDDKIDVEHEDAKKQTGDGVIAVTLLTLKPEGKAWGRRVKTRGLDGLLRSGDHIAADQRKAEPGHVVEVFLEGKAEFGVLAGTGKSLRLTYTTPDFPDVPITTKDLRGVVIAKLENRPNDARALIEYPHGLTISDKF